MQKRKLILICAAVIISGGTMLLAHSIMAPQPVQLAATPVPPANQVLGAARDLPIGTLMKDADLKWVGWPTDQPNPNLYVKGVVDKPVLIGSVLRQSIHAEDPILSSQVVDPHSQGFLAAVLKPGMRAMSISINPNGEVAGFVFPGDRVDVILGHTVNRKDMPQFTDRHMSETVLTNIRVLALDQKTDDQTTDPKIAQLATLEVTPQQAERLVLAAQLGTLSLSLRSLQSEDTLSPPLSPAQVSASALLGDKQTWDSDISQAFPSPGGSDHLLEKVQIMRGKDTTQTVFERQR